MATTVTVESCSFNVNLWRFQYDANTNQSQTQQKHKSYAVCHFEASSLSELSVYCTSTAILSFVTKRNEYKSRGALTYIMIVMPNELKLKVETED